MAFLRWDAKFLVGQSQIDREHLVLFELANGFYDAFMLDHDRNRILELLDRLVEHVERHFDHEETLMRETGYPRLTEHRMQHRHLFHQLSELDRKFRDRAANPTHADVQFLRQWLSNHILHEDSALAAHLGGLQKNQ